MENKIMTNKELKEKTFREAHEAWVNHGRADYDRRNPARAAYRDGKITWEEYLKLAVDDEESKIKKLFEDNPILLSDDHSPEARAEAKRIIDDFQRSLEEARAQRGLEMTESGNEGAE